MCGIAGIINKNGFEATIVSKMTDIIKHRGPNDEGFVVWRNFDEKPLVLSGNDTPTRPVENDLEYLSQIHIETVGDLKVKVALGHRRLAILDLTPAGHQPMSYMNGRYWIVLNGEIYNYIELREELLAKGYQFASNSDTEVVLASYHEWGTDCQHRFNGMWAFVVYDTEKQELFMSRDRYGIKPLYYWFSPDGSLCFASEIKQFTVLPGWKALLNKRRAYDYLFYSLTDHTDETMFKNVHHIPAAHCYISRMESLKPNEFNKIQTTKWYEPKYTGFKGSFEEATSNFKAIFKDAIKLHLRADVAVGTALSGGLDSSAIVCEIHHLLRSQQKTELQKTFSSCALDERFDEKKWVDIVVSETNVDATYLYPKGEDVFELTDKILWHQDEPYQSQSVFLAYHVFRAASEKGVVVLLNGQGADEYVSGYDEFNALRKTEAFRKMRLNELWREWNDKPISETLSEILKIYYYIFPKSARKYFAKKTRRYREIRPLINLSIKGDSHPYDVMPYGHNDVFNIAYRQIFHDPLQRYLRWEDRNSMAHSVEARVPFLDYRLVEFTTQLPTSYLDDKGEPKKIIRYSLAGILPEKIRQRKDKKGFVTPEEKWLKEEFSEQFKKELQQSIADSKGIIHERALVHVTKMMNNQVPFDYFYWHLILFGKWMRLFNVEVE